MSSEPFLRAFSPFVAAREDYFLTLESEGKSPDTIANLRYALLKFERLIGDLDPQQIDANTLRRFMRALQQPGPSTSSQNSTNSASSSGKLPLSQRSRPGADASASRHDGCVTHTITLSYGRGG